MRSTTQPRPLARGLLAIAVPALSTLLAGAALAADPAPDAPPTGAASRPDLPPAPADELDRGTPRGSVHGFLVAAREGDWERAARFLNLGPVPAGERGQRGPQLARQLKTVLDRRLWVDVDLLSRHPEGDGEDGLPRRRDRVGVIETSGGSVDVLIERLARDDGTPIWKISAATVTRIPDLYDEFGYGALGRLLPPFFFESQLFEIQLWQWLGLLLAALGAWLGSWIGVRVIVRVLHPFVERSETDVDDQLLRATLGPLRFFFALGLFALLLLPLGLALPAHRLFSTLEKVLALGTATWLMLRLIDLVAQRAAARLEEREQLTAVHLVPLGRKTVKVVVVGLTVLAALDSFGFDVTALIAGLGIGGLAVALALQKTLENLFGGATLLADRPVRVGDFCRFGDRVGTVEEIGLRSTRVRTLDRTLVTIPNAEFATLQLENFAERDRIWYHPTLGLRYETTPEQLRYVLVETRRMLYAHPRVDPDPARVRFTGFGAHSLDLEVFVYVLATDYSDFLEVAEDLNLRIMDIVEAAGSGFAFPSSTTYVARDEGLDAERQRQAEASVRDWRERGGLFLPGFPPAAIAELSGTLPYPPEGSALR